MQISREFQSPNYDIRSADGAIDFIILHYTEMLFEDALAKLCDPSAKVSCHYLIKEDGSVFQLVDDDMRAWHAGASYWQGRESLNDCSIGIEIDNLGDRPFAELQMKSCIELCKALMEKHEIARENVIGHSDIAPSRKLDPGIYFDWARLAEEGVGINGFPRAQMRGSPETLASSPREVSHIQTNLSALGYKIEVTGKWDEQTNAVVRAFQAHFCPEAVFANGLDFYRDMGSWYEWNESSERALNFMALKLEDIT